MIIWINGPFGAGKTTLVEELSKRLDTAMTVDPKLLGFMLMRMVPPPPTGDFQDLPIWRKLTVRTLQDIRRECDRPLLVPMTLVVPQYLDEIFGSLRMAGEEIWHFFLSLEEALLRTRIENQIMIPDDPECDAGVRQWRLGQTERYLVARGEMPPGTVFLNSGMHGPSALADQVLAALLVGQVCVSALARTPSSAGPDTTGTTASVGRRAWSAATSRRKVSSRGGGNSLGLICHNVSYRIDSEVGERGRAGPGGRVSERPECRRCC
jgi:hypothetical protein